MFRGVIGTQSLILGDLWVKLHYPDEDILGFVGFLSSVPSPGVVSV